MFFIKDRLSSDLLSKNGKPSKDKIDNLISPFEINLISSYNFDLTLNCDSINEHREFYCLFLFGKNRKKEK